MPVTTRSGRPTVSKARYIHTLSGSRPNPWLDVDNFLPLSQASNTAQVLQHDVTQFRFVCLPFEVIYDLTELLPKDSAAALALTCKAMYAILEARCVKTLGAQERWKTVLLLERDSDLLVACHWCQKLHRPLVPRATGVVNAEPELRCVREAKRCLLPGLSPTWCRLVAKRFIRHQPYDDLLALPCRTKVFTSPDIKIVDNSTFRMVDGNMFWRKQIFIAPLTGDGQPTGRSAYLLNTVLFGVRCSHICRHLMWKDLGLNLCCPSDCRSADRVQMYAGVGFEEDDRYASGH